MSRALSLSVVAEGVEQEHQAVELLRLGCEMAQGFFFSPPVGAQQLTAMLQDGPSWIRPGHSSF
jgi:EAL domain-containing protein (putative c-di-GMP-specific phosphodiesterase class I)